jgi:hypothetical protein
MAFSPPLSNVGNRPSDSRFSVRTSLLSGRKVTTSSLRRKVERGAPVSDSTRSICCTPSQACQIRALDRLPDDEDTTKVPM